MNERTVQRQNETVERLSEVGWRFMDKTLPGVGCHHRCFRRCDGLHRELRSCGLKIPTRHTGEDSEEAGRRRSTNRESGTESSGHQ
jgi:hypothetical protein